MALNWNVFVYFSLKMSNWMSITMTASLTLFQILNSIVSHVSSWVDSMPFRIHSTVFRFSLWKEKITFPIL